MDSRNNLLLLKYMFTFWFSATFKKKDNLLHMVCYEIIERFLNLEYVPKCTSQQHLMTSPIYLTTRNQALQAWILEFEMFVPLNLRVWSILDRSDPKKSKNEIGHFYSFWKFDNFL